MSTIAGLAMRVRNDTIIVRGDNVRPVDLEPSLSLAPMPHWLLHATQSQVTINGERVTSGCFDGIALNISVIDRFDANVTLHVGDVWLSAKKDWGAHSAPGWLMNVKFATDEQSTSSGGPSICAVDANRDGEGKYPQIAPSDSLFGAADYAVCTAPTCELQMLVADLTLTCLPRVLIFVVGRPCRLSAAHRLVTARRRATCRCLRMRCAQRLARIRTWHGRIARLRALAHPNGRSTTV